MSERPDAEVGDNRGACEAFALLSIIVPVLNEEGNLAGMFRSLGRSSGTEIIVVDGGSTDGTPDIAREGGARVLSSEPGRARQMNAGAGVASGDTLLFLHADTRLPDGYPEQIEAVLRQSGVVAGAFRLGFDDDRRGLRWIAAGANFRSRLRRLPYGDQALFVLRKMFAEMSGFQDLPVMEDYDFVRRLRRQGRVALAPGYVRTSCRRWLKHGIVRTTLIHQCMIVGWHLGVSPERLARWHGGKDGSAGNPRRCAH